jgi:hypothetical protein
MANRLQFILEELTPDTLRQTNYLIDCNDKGLVSDIGSSIIECFSVIIYYIIHIHKIQQSSLLTHEMHKM